jgi:branched-chain amino acid aminotransferase
MRVYECSIMPQNLIVADEVFLTNAIKGITWVGGYRTKRYENMFTRRMVSLLNNYWKNQLEHEH